MATLEGWQAQSSKDYRKNVGPTLANLESAGAVSVPRNLRSSVVGNEHVFDDALCARGGGLRPGPLPRAGRPCKGWARGVDLVPRASSGRRRRYTRRSLIGNADSSNASPWK